MKKFIAVRKPNGLSTFLSIIISFTFLVIWLPLVRSLLDGDSYVWGYSYFNFNFGGSGLHSDLWFLFIGLAFYAALWISMFWTKNRALYYSLVSLWLVNVFGNFVYQILMMEDPMFHGDTMDVHISITWIVIPLALLAVLISFLTIRVDMKANEEHISWDAKNNKWMLIILGPLPLQALLLATGEPHGITDKIGVLMAITQCFLIPIFLRPFPQKEMS